MINDWWCSGTPTLVHLGEVIPLETPPTSRQQMPTTTAALGSVVLENSQAVTTMVVWAEPCLASLLNTSKYIMSCHAMPCHAMACHVMPCDAMSSHIMPYHVMPYHTVSCHMTPLRLCPGAAGVGRDHRWFVLRPGSELGEPNTSQTHYSWQRTQTGDLVFSGCSDE